MNFSLAIPVLVLSQLLFAFSILAADPQALSSPESDKSAPSENPIYPVLPAESSKWTQVLEFSKQYVAPVAVGMLAIVGVISVVKYLLAMSPSLKNKMMYWNPLEDLQTKISDLNSQVNSLKYGFKHDMQKVKEYSNDLKQHRFKRQGEKINELADYAWSSLESYDCQMRFLCELGATLSWSDTIKRLTSVVEGFSPSRVSESVRGIKSGLMEPTGCSHYVCNVKQTTNPSESTGRGPR